MKFLDYLYQDFPHLKNRPSPLIERTQGGQTLKKRVRDLEHVVRAYDKVINALPKDRLIEFANAIPAAYNSVRLS